MGGGGETTATPSDPALHFSNANLVDRVASLFDFEGKRFKRSRKKLPRWAHPRHLWPI